MEQTVPVSVQRTRVVEAKPPRILISDVLEQGGVEILRAEGYEVDYRPELARADLEQAVESYEALIVRSATNVDKALLERAKALRVVGRAGTGVDNIDVETATRKGILVMNTPGGNTISAAEHTVSMMLALARNIPQAHASVASGKWEKKRFVGMEVFEKTVGIIGLGKIGREVATRCQGLGMNVIGYDPLMQADVALKLRIELTDIEDLFRRSDFLTVHTPLTSDTRGLIGEKTIPLCKRGVRVVNCARGGVVDEMALLKGLNSGQVGGAALDVFEHEPPGENPLLGHEHVIVTPHLGASTEEAQEKVAAQIARQVADALQGRGYAGVVNTSVLQLSIQDDVRQFLLLSQKLGSLAAQVVPGKIRRIVVSAEGELVSGSIELLKAGILTGIFTHLLPDPVNVINAPVLATDMGLSVLEQRGGGERDYLNSLSVRLETSRGAVELAGTVYGASSPRLVRWDRFRIEVNPSGSMLIYRNIDRPGVLASVGSILAAHSINIAGVSLGRTAVGEEALTVMNIDSEVPQEVLTRLGEVEGVSGLCAVRLNP
jgi:D-3-phosphoglycerate dehydrogenase